MSVATKITVAMGRLRHPPVPTMILSSNEQGDATYIHCYSDQARLSVTQHSRGSIKFELILEIRKTILLHNNW
jgi:hypothetical protein